MKVSDNVIIDRRLDHTACMDNDGQYHNDHGPAIQYDDGAEVWYKHGKLHRLDGPAFVTNDPTDPDEWWINHRMYSFEDYVVIARWTEEQIVEWKMSHEY